jgi:8-oxo-dGTP pyrophosphatase MutT (NUDIX family)
MSEGMADRSLRQNGSRIGRVIDKATSNRILARLSRALARPSVRYRKLRVGDAVAGWIDDDRAERLARFDDVFVVNSESVAFLPDLDDEAARSAAIARVAAALAAEGALTAWRGEPYAVGPGFGALPWFLLERAAARYFGVHTWAVHANGVVGGADADAMWFARRSPAKAIDPAMLDNLVGGGIRAGAGVAETLVREAWEEAGIAPDIAQGARPAGAVHIRREQPDGLHWETIFVHDLWLPEEFEPVNQDGEVVAQRLVAVDEAARLIANAGGSDEVTADASLVVLDYLLRHGAIAPDAQGYVELERLRHP